VIYLEIRYLYLIFAFFWFTATILILYVVIKNVGFENLAIHKVIQNNVNLSATDIRTVTIAILLYLIGVAFGLVGVWFYE
jgi:hypothetical protein